MTNRKSLAVRAALLISLLVNLTVISTRIQAATGTCGGASITLPFTDVPASNIFFCSIASAYFSGLTNGTTATTYAPGAAATIAGVGTLTIAANGAYTFTPVADFSGAVPAVTYTVTDGLGTPDTSTKLLSLCS